MRKGVLLLCVCFFMVLIQPALAEEKDSWNIIKKTHSEAEYEIEVDECIVGIIVHLETVTTNRTHPNHDKIEVYLFDQNKWFKRIEIAHEYIEDLNAVQDFIFLINPNDGRWSSLVYVSKIKIVLIGGSNPELLTAKSYIIPLGYEQSVYGDYGYITPQFTSKKRIDFDQKKPGFITYASSYIDICPGWKHERSEIGAEHGIRFKSVRDGIAEISTIVYYGGVGNRVEIFPHAFGVSKTQYKAELKVGLYDLDGGKYVKNPETIAKIQNFPGVEEVAEIAIEGLADIGTQAAEEVLGEIAPKAGKIFGAATTAISVTKNVAEFYEQLGVDDVMLNVQLLRYPSVYLKKDNDYEISFSFQAFADAVCVGGLTAAWSYVDFCYKDDVPCNYIKPVLGFEGSEFERKFVDRGIAFYDTLILYRPIPLKYKPLEVRIKEPKSLNFSAEKEIYFEAVVKGGKPPYTYEWFDCINDEKIKLSNKFWFEKKLLPGEHLIILKVNDSYGYRSTDSVVINVIPKKPILNVKGTKRGIELRWSKYEGEGFAGYQILGREAESDRFIHFDYIRDRSENYYEFSISAYPFLADHEICFKVRLIANGIFSESDEFCAKMPIRLSVAESGENYVTLSWTSVETKRTTLGYSTNPFFENKREIEIMAERNKFVSNYTLTDINPGTTYYLRIKDKNGIYSNVVKAKTLTNFPPHIRVKYAYEIIISPRYRDYPRPLKITFSSDFYGDIQKKVTVTMKTPNAELGKLEIADATGGISKIEWDLGDGFRNMPLQFTKNLKPGIHVFKIRATDKFNTTAEKSFVINIKSKPWLSEVKVDGKKLYDMFYSKLEISVDAVDADGNIKAVNFYASTSDGTKKKFLGKDADGFDGWKIKWDIAKIFDEWREHNCKWKKIKGENKCYFDVNIYAEAVDSDGLKTNSSKKISILQPLPDLAADTEIQRVERVDSELLDEMKIKLPLDLQTNLTLDKGGDNITISGFVKNKGQGTFTGEIPYVFYMKRKIPCPSWYLKSLGCLAKLPSLELRANTSKNTTGFICPKANVGSYGGGSPPSCIPLPTCYCTKEIYSGTVIAVENLESGYVQGNVTVIRSLEPGDWVHVSATVSKRDLEKFAEETKIGKKIEVIFAIDGNDKILEEDEFNNVVSRDIWIESRIKPQLIKGGNPKSFWYGFGRYFEWLDLMFTFDNKAKFEKELKQASKRLEEAERMLKVKDFETAGNLLKDYSKNMESASQLAEKLPAEERLEQSKVLMIITSSYVNILKDIYTKEISNEFENALDSSLRIQEKAIKRIADAEPMVAPMMLQFESIGLRPDLEILDVNIPAQILAGETVEINLRVLNSGNADSDFKIILYEEGNPVKSTSETICAGCMNNYKVTWVAKRIDVVSIGLEEPEDANQENNYVTLSVEVVSPVCYSDQECSDENPCTRDVCIARGTAEARCEHIEITQCIDGDGCCPSGCNALNDNDCKALCGNQICEPGEQDKCCIDCGCPEGYECKDNECVLVVYCGNGVCEFNENRCNCPEDCGYCEGSCKDEPCWKWECVDDECQCELQANCCGNYACEEGEYYLECKLGEFNTQCPQDCCDPFTSHQADEWCQCPPGTEKIIINPETGEFVCECMS